MPNRKRRARWSRRASPKSARCCQHWPRRDADIDIRDVRKDIRKADPSQPGVVLYDIKCGVHIKVTDLSKWKALVAPLDRPCRTWMAS